MQEKSVVVKGVGDGFRIIIDKNTPESVLMKEINKVLTPLEYLLTGAHIYIDSENFDNGLDQKLFPFLKEKFQIESISQFKDQENVKTDHKKRLRERESMHSWENSKSDVLIIAGRVRSGQRIDTNKHIVIYGDVNPGAEVIAGGDIIVLGTLSGTAAAGQKQDDNSIIFSLDFKPTQIQINDIVGMGGAKKGKKLPEIAFLNESKDLVIKTYIEENPFSRLPWPEVR